MGAKYIEVDGVVAPLAEHARIFGIKYSTAARRIAAGWSAGRALKSPPRPPAAARTPTGAVLTAADVVRLTGVSVSLAYERLKSDDPLRPKTEPKKYPWKGEELTIREIAEREGLSKQTARDRAERELKGTTKKPKQTPAKIVLDGIEATVAEHAKRTGASKTSVRNWAKADGRSRTAHWPEAKRRKNR